MCGEHSVKHNAKGNDQGSSPHVRGAPMDASINWGHVGIIPACAGSTLGMGNWCRFRWDHPRMCGEHMP